MRISFRPVSFMNFTLTCAAIPHLPSSNFLHSGKVNHLFAFRPYPVIACKCGYVPNGKHHTQYNGNSMSVTGAEKDISSLIAMARQGTLHSRQILAENILDLSITDEGRLSDRERALIDQVLVRLVKEFELQIRQKLAGKLADSPVAPKGLLEMLANDEIEVARPVLQRSKLLSDETLIEIVRQRTKEHLLCIAIRDTVSEGVSQALIDRDVPEVIEALIRNPKAELSAAAMAYLVAESRRFDQFQEPLLRRTDLPSNLAHSMFWWVSAALRNQILTEHPIKEHELDMALESVTSDLIETDDEARRLSTENTAVSLAQKMENEQQLTPETLIDLLRRQRISAFCAGFSILAGVNFTTVNRIILDPDLTPFAILCRSTDIPEAYFSAMALLLQSRHTRKQSATLAPKLLDLFKEISPDSARITLRYWHSDSVLQKNVAGKAI
jgi:uncharacterized protein (DUF2336 family)